jgi:gamma-glutamylcyclotransferase
VKIFAYGSNMCRGWLERKISSANLAAVAALRGHQLRFHKKSKDGSGKADAYQTGSPFDIVWGVVLEVNDEDKARLDTAEGLGHGYLERVVDVTDRSGCSYAASMYYADMQAIDSSLRPYTWYLRLVLEGARAHNLPPEYVDNLEVVETSEDSVPERAAEAQVLAC